MTLGTTLPSVTVSPLRRVTDGRGRSTRASLAVRRPVELEIVIPALDEERRLPATLRHTLGYLADQPFSSAVVVVDNGSTDATADLVRAEMGGPVPVHVVGCALPGKGAAVRRGFMSGRSDMVGFMDADLSTPVETLDRVVPLLRRGATSVIASRSVDDASRAVPQGLVRRVGGDLFRATAKTVLPGVADSQCGFKFFDGPTVRSMLGHCEIDGFSFDLELLGRLQRAGHEIVELPVVWTDSAGSTFRPLKHGMRSFSDTLRIHRLLAEQARQVPVRPADIDLGEPARAAEGSVLAGVR